MPVFVSVLGDALLVFSFYLYYLVFRENSYAASSIKTFEGQKVISTGPYARVRHPKYVGDLFLVIGIPLALGSWWALALIVLSIAGLVWRILDEEKLLKKDLPGYIEYTQKVRYRLVPYLW
jgi:protein-S-isoprenylcysteine O-methyltransferase Ste14